MGVSVGPADSGNCGTGRRSESSSSIESSVCEIAGLRWVISASVGIANDDPVIGGDVGGVRKSSVLRSGVMCGVSKVITGGGGHGTCVHEFILLTGLGVVGALGIGDP